MVPDIRAHISKCAICESNKQPKKKPRAALKDFRVGYPMDRVAVDVMGPLPLSAAGNKYILCIGDNFTRWIEAKSELILLI